MFSLRDVQLTTVRLISKYEDHYDRIAQEMLQLAVSQRTTLT